MIRCIVLQLVASYFMIIKLRRLALIRDDLGQQGT